MSKASKRFTPTQRWLNPEQASHLQQMVLSFGPLAPETQGSLLDTIDAFTGGEGGWPFMMLNPERYRFINKQLADNARRPRLSQLLFATVLCHVLPDTNEVAASRGELAEECQTSPSHISTAMRELEQMNVLARRKQGKRSRWFLNHLVATNLPKAARAKMQAKAVELQELPPHRDRRAGKAALANEERETA